MTHEGKRVHIPISITILNTLFLQKAQFTDFIRYVADPVNDPKTANQHWRPQSELCHPCHIDYDFIGHYDTIQQDAAFPFDDPDNQRRRKTKAVVTTMFRQADSKNVDRLRNVVYRDDMDLFGYDWNIINGTITTLSSTT